MFGIGMQELAIIFVVALLIFGPKRLPELARTLGKGLAEFRRASTDLRQSFNLEMDAQPPSPATAEKDPRSEREPATQPEQLVDSQSDEDYETGHADMADDDYETGHVDMADEEEEEARAAEKSEPARSTPQQSGGSER